MEFVEMEEDKQLAKIRLTAMNMLTYREYSRLELTEKLDLKFDHSPLIEQAVNQLVKENLQSDQRFSEAFVRSRVARGQGEIRIRMELCERGIEKAMANQTINQCEVDWFALAKDVTKNKYGDELATDNREKAKRMRFLQYRGFTYEQINYAVANSDSHT